MDWRSKYPVMDPSFAAWLMSITTPKAKHIYKAERYRYRNGD